MDPSAPPAPAPTQQPPLDPPATTLPTVHEAHVAIPTPTVPPAAAAPPSHPPYAQMITEAITALKDKNGSSKKAIAKYIDRVYSNLPGTHSALLTHHLKRLKESGLLVMVKHSYMLAGSAPQVQANGPKRGPGRPPKPKPAVNIEAQQVSQLQPLVNTTAGPGPISFAESVFASLGLVDGPVAVAKGRRGRPRKAEAGGVGLRPNPTVVKKRPGRPPKNGAGNAAPGSGVLRPRGRPPKNADGPAKPRGRPPKNAGAPATVGGAAGPVLVPMGYVAEAATVTAPAFPTVAALPSLKKPGRPRKTADSPKKPRNLSGKPLGRPKKNAPAIHVQVSNLQQLMANQELKSKLEFFQSRIKQTVGILKPCLDSQTPASALAALQELEELAAIDVTAPLNIEDRQPPPPENQV